MSNFPLSIKDQMGRPYDAQNPPLRIISLVPSITELLYDLGLQNEVVGLTKFCIHPKSWSNSKVKIGGTKKLNHKRISELKPDLIIGNKEENTQEDIETLQKNYKVFMTDVNNFEDAIEMIDLIGLICNRQKESDQLNTNLKKEISKQEPIDQISAIYLIWKDPYFAVGQNTFINSMLHLAGFKNLIETERYPEITIETINELRPKLLLLSTEPYPFNTSYLSDINSNLFQTKPILVDGEMFSWYGSRLLKSFEYFKQLKLDLEQK